MFGDSDLPTFFGDMGVPVAFSGKNGLGLFDRPIAIKLADMGYGGIEAQAPLVRLAYNAFSPQPRAGDTIFVNGTQYTVGSAESEADGAVVAYELKAVS
jgi:hypothetical protein